MIISDRTPNLRDARDVVDMLVVFVALGITLVAGLIEIPTIENAQALITGGSIIGQRLQLFNQLRNILLCGIFSCELERTVLSCFLNFHHPFYFSFKLKYLLC